MGNMAGYRAAFAKAEKYRREWDAWLTKKEESPPDRDLQLETLADVLRGKAFVQNHCYRADEWGRCSTWPVSSAFTSAPSITRWRPTRSPTSWLATAWRAQSGPTGGVSRWSRSTAFPRTLPCYSRPALARSSTPTAKKEFSGSTRRRPRRCTPAATPESTSPGSRRF